MGNAMRVQTAKFVRIAVTGSVLGLVSFLGGTARGWSQGRNSSSQTPTQQQQQQQLPGMPPGNRGIAGPTLDPDTDTMTARMAEQQAKSRNSDRQKRLETDTQKLLALATELKEQVNKTDKNIMSLDVIKKADEIERLAKSVKERMKG
jgi:hypothetical protein